MLHRCRRNAKLRSSNHRVNSVKATARFRCVSSARARLQTTPPVIKPVRYSVSAASLLGSRPASRSRAMAASGRIRRRAHTAAHLLHSDVAPNLDSNRRWHQAPTSQTRRLLHSKLQPLWLLLLPLHKTHHPSLLQRQLLHQRLHRTHTLFHPLQQRQALQQEKGLREVKIKK